MKYQVNVGNVSFGEIEAKSLNALNDKVKDIIENLNPLNSSEEGREAYRDRFRNQPISYKLKEQKDFKELVV